METPDLRTPTPKQQELLASVAEGNPRAQELLGWLGAHEVRSAIESARDDIGVPDVGTPEFAAMIARVRAERTPEEVQAYEDDVIKSLEF